ncbi:MAG: apolipoprotein N-acyltransferase [Beijerinckiaceae bacterium]|jgi:apolipoprotein N-acyltransferase|nr:apolipoprotein N-acyltransferase [Beijerinckiaceae bacterium]
MLRSLGDSVMLSWGWRRRMIAVVGGAVGALTLAPFGLWPLLVVPFTIAVWLLDGVASPSRHRRLGQAFADGWFWGFGYFVAGLWWLGAAFLVEADKFLWAMPFGVFGLPMVLAFFPATGFALAQALWRPGASRIFALAGAIGFTEWCRSWLFTGFPWNAFGQALAENSLLSQTAALVGLHGLTVLAVGLAATPAVIVGLGRTGQQVATGLMALGVLCGMALFGWQRIPAQASPLVAGVKLRIMQPNLPQDDKFQPDKGREIVERYLAISDRATSPRTLGLQDVTHLIWPESAFPFLLDRTPAALQRISSALPRGVTLITGAARAGASLPGESQPPIFNAIQVITREGGIVASYDKHHLVPFGEYLPSVFERLMHGLGLTAFVAIPGGFTASAGRTVLDVPGLPPVAASICYEAIFPGEVLPQGGASGTVAARRPQVLLNVTNDAWFGRTPGPYQHASQARLRAIEEGMPMVRAANNGVSSVVDAYGRVVASLPLGTDGVLDTGLPRAIGPTTFSRVGNLPAGALMFVCVLLAVAGRLRRRPLSG